MKVLLDWIGSGLKLSSCYHKTIAGGRQVSMDPEEDDGLGWLAGSAKGNQGARVKS